MLKRSRSIIFMAVPALTLLGLSLLSFVCLTSTTVSAEETLQDNVDISVPVSCNLNSSVDTAHTAIVNAGTSVSDIGTTNFTVFCNDASGFALYAIGYTNEDDGDNTLVGQTTSNIINTGQATSGNTSAWAMKMIKVTDGSYQPNNLTITNNFNNYKEVPDTYTKVAEYTTSTDATLGSKLQSTYQAFMSTYQDADTYNGKVKYTLVHPYTAPTPVPVSKNLYYAITGSADNYTLTISDSDITSGAVASGPVAIDGYTFDEDEGVPTTPWYSYADQIKSVVVSGTVAPTSTRVWFAQLNNCNSWNLSGLKTDNVTDMSGMFSSAGYSASSFTLDLSSWNTSNVTYMSDMFSSAGYSATTWSIGNLSNWNTSNVTDMSGMFYEAGYSASSFTLDLSSWNTASVTNMISMFSNAGYSASSFTLDLSSWNTANVTNMNSMFSNAGLSATTWSIGDLSSWNTSSVTSMSFMFSSAGRNATAWSIGNLTNWNTSSVTNMYGMFSFAGYSATTWSVGSLSNWNTSRVTNMYYMFIDAGYSASSFILDLSSWNTSNVTDMNSMFYSAGHNATTWSVGNLSNWNTSSVTDMYRMFSSAGYSATTWSIGDLSSWNTASVTNMNSMFSSAGYSASSFTLDLSNWNTSSVTNMSYMFYYAGRNATTWSVTIPKTNNGTASGPITNTTSRLYGKTTSTSVTPPTGRSFILAN